MKWPPPRIPLEGSIVRMEPATSSHHDGLLAASRDPATWTWLDRRIPDDEAVFTSWFDARLAASGVGTEWCFVTHSIAEGHPIGSSSLLNARPEHDHLEIGWTWLHPDSWRTGANLEAKLLMLTFAFDGLGCMRVEFKTDARNERSRVALAALPATLEGVFRKHMLMPGIGVRDSAYYAIVDDEWPEVRANLERRLAREAAHA
jgi:RimJ/RimL family protein N-acetyltransferase